MLYLNGKYHSIFISVILFCTHIETWRNVTLFLWFVFLFLLSFILEFFELLNTLSPFNFIMAAAMEKVKKISSL